ncbi:MAG: response regulator [Minicystis sp.]
MTGHLTDGVLVVEDDTDVREILVEILEEHGYHATPAANGLEALQRLRDEGMRPRLILLDLMMPIMDGRTFRREQRRDPALADIPVVVLSAYLDVHGLVEDMAVQRFLEKPVDLDQLLRVVEEQC